MSSDPALGGMGHKLLQRQGWKNWPCQAVFCNLPRAGRAAGRPAVEAGAARSEETAAKAAWPIPAMKARSGEQHCMSSCAGRSRCPEQMGLKCSLGTRLLSCISWCRSAFAGEVPVCKLQKGSIWDYSDIDGKDTGSSNEKARENARETWDLAEDDKGLGSPRAPAR